MKFTSAEGPGQGKPEGELTHMAQYNAAARARMQKEREEAMSPRDKLSEARLRASPKSETGNVVSLPEKRRMMPGKELPPASNIVRFPERGRAMSSVRPAEALGRAVKAFQNEADIHVHKQLAELLFAIEQRGIPSGPRILEVGFLPEAGLDERVSFLKVLERQISSVDEATMRALQIYHASISHMRGLTGLPQEEKRAYIVVRGQHPEVPASEWTGYLVDRPQSEDERRLGDVLRDLVHDQDERQAERSRDASDWVSEWFGRLARLIRRKS